MSVAEGISSVLCADNKIITTALRGVKPLMQWLQQGCIPKGFSAADKVVGKATALLYCLLGVRRVHGRLMSVSAVKVLRAQGIEASWDTLTEHILNRSKLGLCPIESALLGIEDPEEGLPILRRALSRIGTQ